MALQCPVSEALARWLVHDPNDTARCGDLDWTDLESDGHVGSQQSMILVGTDGQPCSAVEVPGQELARGLPECLDPVAEDGLAPDVVEALGQLPSGRAYLLVVQLS